MEKDVKRKVPMFLEGTDIVTAKAGGGTLREVTPYGEWVSEIYVPPGRHRASFFMIGIGNGHGLEPGDGVECFSAPVRTVVNTFGELAYETAASQTFRVDRADRERRRNDRLERQLSAQQRRQELLERALLRSRGTGEEPAVQAETEDASDEDAGQ